MSSDASRDTSGSRNAKPSKPFCSLAYLAKSTIAVHGTNDIIGRGVNGHSNKNHSASNSTGDNRSCPSSSPNVAATAKVNDRGSPSLPTGAAISVDNSQSSSTTCPINNRFNDKDSKGEGDDHYRHSSVSEVFGVINEEDIPSNCDQVDGELRRPWELTNGRIPSSLTTAVQQQQQLNNGGSVGLPSLSKFNSIDCWDYTIELECLKGPQGNS